MNKAKKVLIGVGAGLLIGLLIVGGVFATRYYLNGRLPKNTYISGLNFSHSTPEGATAELQKLSEELLNKPIKVRIENREHELTLAELGVAIFPEETVNIIKPIESRNLSFLDFFQAPPRNNLKLITKLDEGRLLEVLEKEFFLSEFAPKPAEFYFDEDSKLMIREEEEGFVIDKEKLQADINNITATFSPKQLEIQLLKTEPVITKEVLATKEEEVKSHLRHSLKLIDPVYSDPWYVSLIDHLDWVEFVSEEYLAYAPIPNRGEHPQQVRERIAIKINEEKLNGFIDAEIAEWLDRASETVNIYTNDEGGVVIEGEGHNGLKIERERLKDLMEKAIMKKISAITIPVKEIEPEIIVSEDLQELGIQERISIGHTSYYGSPANRVHNIKVGASKFNGKLIAPGETFSFNQNLGAVDGSTGYLKELVIKPEGTIPEYGGGICQVSTTLYRAILLGGLPIDERNQHSYAVSYYSQILGHGLDATIYLGGPDLQFTNDTGSHLLVQTYTKDDYELYFVLYGTDPGRTVELEGPYLSNYHSPGPTVYQDTESLPAGQTKQVEKSHTGFTALWYRHITDKNGETVKETISTKYKAIPAKILVGTAGAEET